MVGELEEMRSRCIRIIPDTHSLDELGNGKEDGGDSEEYGIGVEKRREQVAAKYGGVPWSTGSSFQFERTSHVSPDMVMVRQLKIS